MTKITSIPLSPFPLKVLKSMSGRFTGIGTKISHTFPYLELNLHQAGIDIEPEEYGSIMFIVTTFHLVLWSLLFPLLLSKFTDQYLLIGLSMSLVFALLVFIQLSAFPVILVKKKIREIEKNLVFALRTMLVQIKGGVSLFETLNLIGEGQHGQLSKEFKKAVDKINTGMDQEDALQELAADNPSPYLRKAIWQIINGMRAGSDIASVLEESMNTMNREVLISIRKYGAQLRLLSLMYMMIGVIIPALGLTFLVVLSSFPKIDITEILFWGLLGMVVVMEFMYIGIIKSKRPTLMS